MNKKITFLTTCDIFLIMINCFFPVEKYFVFIHLFIKNYGDIVELYQCKNKFKYVFQAAVGIKIVILECCYVSVDKCKINEDKSKTVNLLLHII